jgi:CubicO group peptidase (beta-lactamase class C family)
MRRSPSVLASLRRDMHGRATPKAWVVPATVLLALMCVLTCAAGAAGSYDAADAAMRARVSEDGLAGGVLLVARDGKTLHRVAVGDMTMRTVMPIASASKWLTSATLMTFVDDGKLHLDDPVAKYLPAFDGEKEDITVRQLLSHTSGLPSAACEGDPSVTLKQCVASIAAGGDPSSIPGTQFHYSGVGFAVAGRLIERLAGRSFERAFEDRIADPLGMTHTRFDGIRRPHSRNPSPAASATSTVADYARFVRMIAADGTVNGKTVLSPSSVAEIEKDQVAGLDTHADSAVQITGIPTYGLGVWRDQVAEDDSIEVVSGSGALGFYPWIDRVHGNYGIVAVDDELHGAEHAVPASQRIAQMLWRAAPS